MHCLIVVFIFGSFHLLAIQISNYDLISNRKELIPLRLLHCQCQRVTANWISAAEAGSLLLLSHDCVTPFLTAVTYFYLFKSWGRPFPCIYVCVWECACILNNTFKSFLTLVYLYCLNIFSNDLWLELTLLLLVSNP